MDPILLHDIQNVQLSRIPVQNDLQVPYDAQFKVLIVGDSRVGKSSILKRLIEGKFEHNLNCTVGVEFGNYVAKVDDKSVVQLQIWDTAG